MRFAVFAEKASEVLTEARQVQALPSLQKGMSDAAIRERVSAKQAAEQDIATFEPLLYPPDEEAA